MIIKILMLLVTTNTMAGLFGLLPVPVPEDPIENPSTVDKVLLGKTLFWDEQLSSTKTVACGTCHIMSSGGTDPRSTIGNVAALNPGHDGVFETADDIIGSPGVAESCQSGALIWNINYGYDAQVTSRKSPSVINAGSARTFFWDGRAGFMGSGTEEQLVDPVTNQIILASGAGLEALILEPPINSVEMGHTGRTWQDVIGSIESASPLALSPLLPEGMSNWIGNQSYYQLFEKVYGSSEITASKIAMAIASYVRSLFSTQTAWDDALNGNINAMNEQEMNGANVFIPLCHSCHLMGSGLGFEKFTNTGVTANEEDECRFAVTGNNSDRGRFKAPSLRNLDIRTSFMHNSGFTTLEEVVEFYDRGGDVLEANLDAKMVPLNLSQQEKDDMVYFLRNSLSDQRAEDETGPFSSPLLYSESDRVPTTSGTYMNASINSSKSVLFFMM